MAPSQELCQYSVHMLSQWIYSATAYKDKRKEFISQNLHRQSFECNTSWHCIFGSQPIKLQFLHRSLLLLHHNSEICEQFLGGKWQLPTEHHLPRQTFRPRSFPIHKHFRFRFCLTIFFLLLIVPRQLKKYLIDFASITGTLHYLSPLCLLQIIQYLAPWNIFSLRHKIAEFSG